MIWSDQKIIAAVIIGIVVVLLALPIIQGFHFGCNVWAGDTQKTTMLGIEYCR